MVKLLTLVRPRRSGLIEPDMKRMINVSVNDISGPIIDFIVVALQYFTGEAMMINRSLKKKWFFHSKV